MYLTNNVLRRELERILRVAARTDDDPKRLVTQNRPSGGCLLILPSTASECGKPEEGTTHET